MKKGIRSKIDSIQNIGLWIIGKRHLLAIISEKEEAYKSLSKAYDELSDHESSLNYDNEQHIATIQRLNNSLGQKESLIEIYSLI